MPTTEPRHSHVRNRAQIDEIEGRIAAVLAYAPKSSVHMADENLAGRFGVSVSYLQRIRLERGIEHEREPWEEETR